MKSTWNSKSLWFLPIVVRAKSNFHSPAPYIPLLQPHSPFPPLPHRWRNPLPAASLWFSGVFVFSTRRFSVAVSRRAVMASIAGVLQSTITIFHRWSAILPGGKLLESAHFTKQLQSSVRIAIKIITNRLILSFAYSTSVTDIAHWMQCDCLQITCVYRAYRNLIINLLLCTLPYLLAEARWMGDCPWWSHHPNCFLIVCLEADDSAFAHSRNPQGQIIIFNWENRTYREHENKNY